MANFNTHLTAGVIISSAVAGLGFYFQLYGLTTAVLCVMVGTLGSLLPDIDLDSSKPAKQGFFTLSLISSTLITIIYANRYQSGQLLLHSLLIWAIGFVIMRGATELFSRLTVHRGMVHSVPYMAVFALGVVYGAFYGLKLTAFVSWIFGMMLFIGAMVHLALDEIYSVNIYGLRLKKSAGTAMKFIEKDKLIWYAGLYSLIAALCYKAPPYGDFVRVITKIARGMV